MPRAHHTLPSTPTQLVGGAPKPKGSSLPATRAAGGSQINVPAVVLPPPIAVAGVPAALKAVTADTVSLPLCAGPSSAPSAASPAAATAAATAPAAAPAAAAPAAAAPALAPAAAPAAAPGTAPTCLPTVTLKKGPPQKSYLPVFIAPEAHGKQKQRQPNSVEKDVEERIARAEKEKEKKARLAAKKKKKAVAPQARAAADDDEEDENWKLMLTIAIGVLVALTEAIDIDILLGILFIPVMSVMKRLSDYFDTEALDPAVWIAAISNGYNNLCKEHPAVRASPLWRDPRTTLTASSPTSFVASDEPLFHPGAHPPRSPSAPRGSSAPQEEMPRRCRSLALALLTCSQLEGCPRCKCISV